jgi:hypothetical protein
MGSKRDGSKVAFLQKASTRLKKPELNSQKLEPDSERPPPRANYPAESSSWLQFCTHHGEGLQSLAEMNPNRPPGKAFRPLRAPSSYGIKGKSRTTPLASSHFSSKFSLLNIRDGGTARKSSKAIDRRIPPCIHRQVAGRHEHAYNSHLQQLDPNPKTSQEET